MLSFIKKIFTRSNNNDLTYNEMMKMIKEQNEIKIIDVRSNQEYNEGHINGAINVPVYKIDNTIQGICKNKNSIIIVYCQSGLRSKKAKKILENIGYINVYNLKGGLNNI